LAQLAVEDLEIRYGQVRALHGVSLTVASGELFVLLGGSGSGKTTLLRTLGGFIAPTTGRVLLDGRDITRLPPHRRPVNTVFQSYALFPHLTAAENVAFGLHRQGLPAPQIAARTAELLQLVRLEAFAGRRPDALSGGQRQRVALARALAPKPGLLLLDEPLSALDRSLREQTRTELLRIQRETGTTFILVTHDQDEALSIASRIGLLHEGRLAQLGTPADLYERPASRYVAAFMGAENILPATARPDGVLDLPGVGEARPPVPPLPGPLHIALRPERLRLSTEPRAGPNAALGTVTATAYHGDHADHRIRVDAGAELLVSLPLGQGAPAHSPGTRLTVHWPAEACILLPH